MVCVCVYVGDVPSRRYAFAAFVFAFFHLLYNNNDNNNVCVVCVALFWIRLRDLSHCCLYVSERELLAK